MTDNKLQHFIDNYTQDDFDRIRVMWNGKYGQEFRQEVCEFVIPQIEKVNILLIRDLYCETAKTSPMTFGIYLNFHFFANELLVRGGNEYLLDYIRGASHSMDTALSSGRLTISKEQAKKLLTHFDYLKATSQDKDEQRLLSDYIRYRFEYNANK